MQNKYRERWNDRRRKTNNWRKTIIMVVALVAILVVINKLDNIGPQLNDKNSGVIESDTTSQAAQPEQIPSAKPADGAE